MKSMRKKNALLHLLCCSVFLLMPVLISTRPPEEPFLTVTKPFIRDIIGNAMLLAFFYLNYYWLIPKLYYRRKYVLYIGLILLSLLLVITLPSIFTGRLFAMPRSTAPSVKPGLINPMPAHRTVLSFLFDEMKHHLYLFIIALFFSLMLRIRQRLFQAQEDKLNAELSSLKAQINPHFLFNTLNSIYALAVKKDDKTADAVINLSELMRYIIKDAHNNKVALEKELNYIGNYIDLQKSRLGNTARIYFTSTGNFEGKEIAPLILITFIENAFKYGINPDADSEIRIQIDIEKSDLHMQVFNKKVKTINNTGSTGIGIQNTKERLQLLYPSKHHITIQDTNIYFSVDLIITLT
jgi:hypothetical protein